MSGKNCAGDVKKVKGKAKALPVAAVPPPKPKKGAKK